MGNPLNEESESKIGYINKIIPFSNVDGPGNRMAIFFQGCNLKCKYCHNPETIEICTVCKKCLDTCPKNALEFISDELVWNEQLCIDCNTCLDKCFYNSSPKVKKMTTHEILNEANKIKHFIRGITISGGECTYQKEFLNELIKKFKSEDFHVLIDSNGLFDINDIHIKEVINLVDGIMIDIKMWNNNKHKELTGIDNKIIKSNLKKLIEMTKITEVRTVIYENDMDDLLDTIKNVTDVIVNKKIHYRINKYRIYGVRDKYKKQLKPPSDSFIRNVIKIFELTGFQNWNIL